LKIDECLSLTKERYWHLPAVANAATIEPGYSQCSRQLKSFLYDAVEKRMISDVPLGAFLSGGIDSTIIVALMSEMSSKPVKTFTIRNSVKAYDESAKAQAVAHLYRTDHTEWTFDNDYIPDKIDGILANFDEPFADSSALPTYIVAELASRHVKVALTGDGGDELFAGYTRYLTFKYLRLFRTIPESVRNGVLKPLVNNIKFPKFLELKFNQLRKLVNNEGIEPFEQYHNLQRLGYSEADVRRFLPGLAGLAGAKALSKDIFSALEGKSDLERALVTDICIGLEGDMLVKVDRTSMLNSIEARSPFLDFRLIEHSMRIPDKYKLNGSTLKWILRNTFADKFPPEILRKPKMGFGIPVGALMRRELRSRIEELMKLDSLRATGLFDMDAMAVLFAEHCGHLDRSFRLWTFFVFASWFKKNLPFIEP
jgi:asparagine synthase (glutamine-hydrolysing)